MSRIEYRTAVAIVYLVVGLLTEEFNAVAYAIDPDEEGERPASWTWMNIFAWPLPWLAFLLGFIERAVKG